jgi:hypothetical protein
VNGLTVQLFSGSSCSGAALQTTTTADSGGQPGYYRFENLCAGQYSVKFSNLPAGYQFTTQGPTAAKDATDCDADASGCTGAIELADAETDLSWDAGIVSSPAVAVPTLSEWAMLLLAGLLAMVGVHWLRTNPVA